MERVWKRSLAVLMALLTALGCAGCGGETAPEKNAAPVSAASELAPAPAEESDAETADERQVVSFRFDEPEGFYPLRDNDFLLLTADYPRDPSFVSIALSERDESILAHTPESYREYLTTALGELFGESVTVTIDSFGFREIEGCPCLRAVYFMEADGLHYAVLCLNVVTDCNYELLFADGSSDGRWMKSFNAASKTLDIIWSDEIWMPDEEEMETYGDGTGLSVRMPGGMSPLEVEGTAMFYASDAYMMSAWKESFELLEAAGLKTAEMTLKDYARAVERNNGGAVTFEIDSDGYPICLYKQEVNGVRFMYYSTLRLGSDAGWMVTFGCLEDEMDTYLPRFPRWAGTIEVE